MPADNYQALVEMLMGTPPNPAGPMGEVQPGTPGMVGNAMAAGQGMMDQGMAAAKGAIPPELLMQLSNPQHLMRKGMGRLGMPNPVQAITDTVDDVRHDAAPYVEQGKEMGSDAVRALQRLLAEILPEPSPPPGAAGTIQGLLDVSGIKDSWRPRGGGPGIP